MSNIKAGDLVMLVRGHECLMRVGGGFPFRAGPVLVSANALWCCSCGAANIRASAEFINGPGGLSYPLVWLLKIDPPAEPASIRETLHLPERVPDVVKA